MPVNTLIYANKNIVYVNTAIDSNAIVFLSNASYFGQTVTIKDSAGKAGPTNIIRITTCNDVSYLDPTLSNLTIQQPFGYLTFTASSEKKWSLANTFAFDTMFTSATINTPNLNTILFKDRSINGRISIMSVDNGNLLLNGCNILNDEPVEIIVTDPFIGNTINASNVTINNSNTTTTLFLATGVSLDTNTNIQTSYNGSNWSNTNGNFYNGFGSKLLYVNNNLIALGGNNYSWHIKTTLDGINWITRATQNFTSSSQPVLDIKYGNGYYVVLAGSYSDSNSRVYTSTDLINWTEPNTFPSYPLKFCTSLEFGGAPHNVFLIAEPYKIFNGDPPTISNFIYIYDPSSSEQTQYFQVTPLEPNLNFYINKIKYSTIDETYLVNGYTYENNDPTNYRISQITYHIKDDVKLNEATDNIEGQIAIYDLSFCNAYTFTAYDIYINQNTEAEVGLPKVVYFGSNSSNDESRIYYSYSNILVQENFQTISNSPGYTLNNIYSVFQYQGSLYLATDGSPGNLIILDSNSFATSNYTNIRSNNLTTTYSYQIIDNFFQMNNNLLNISNKMTTNFLSLSNATISSSNNILYRNNYAINPVGAHIEFKDTSSNFSTYPLYIGSLSNFNNGWWDKTYNKNVSAFIVESGYKLDVYSEPNYTSPLICSVSNTTSNPIYSNVYNLATPYSNASYNLTSL